jgi:hypothetical protein
MGEVPDCLIIQSFQKGINPTKFYVIVPNALFGDKKN